jgi:hypothetical protein
VSQRGTNGFAGDLLAISWQVAAAVGIPLFGAAWLSQNVTQDTGIQLAIVLAGLTVAGAGMFLVIRRYMSMNPVPPTSEAARKAGRAWEREIAEQEREREAERER